MKSRIVLLVLLAVCGWGYLRYRALERRARLVPEMTRTIGTVRSVLYQFETLNRQYIPQYETRWNLACVKHQWMVARPGSAGDDYRREMETFTRVVDDIQAKYSWDVLGRPAAETARRLTKLRAWFEREKDNQEDWLCNDERMLDKLARLSEVSVAWERCLKELATRSAEQVLADGTPAFATCARDLPDSMEEEAAEDEAPSLAERVVPIGASEPGDEIVRVLTGERQWRNYVESPDGRRIAYVVKRGQRQLVIVDGEAGLPYEHVWAGMEGGANRGGPIFSDDSEHVAYSAKREDGWHVVVDGEEGPAWSSVQGLALSREDGRFAYGAASREGRWHAVVDGREEELPLTIQGRIVFSPDGRRVAYHSEDEHTFFLVANGVRGRAYPRLFNAGPFFSPDSRRIAYVAMRDAELVVAVDGEEMPGLAAVVPPVVFSPDSRHVAYVANGLRSEDSSAESQGQVVVVDGTPGPRYDRVAGFAFSDDSQHHLYVGAKGKRSFVVVDGREHGPYDALSSPGPRFSPDSAHVGWAAVMNGNMHLVIDGELGAGWPGGIAGGSPVWSPDASRVAYVASRGRQAFAVVDDREGVAYDSILGNVVFSPDGAHFAYIAQRGDRWYVVRDKRESAAYEGIVSTVPVFSDDAERLAFVAKRGPERFVVVDGKEQPGFRDVAPGSLCFGPDSAHVAYTALKAGWRLVVDGKATVGRVASRSDDLPLRFTSATQVSMLGPSTGRSHLVRLEVTLPGRTAMRGAGSSAE